MDADLEDRIRDTTFGEGATVSQTCRDCDAAYFDSDVGTSATLSLCTMCFAELNTRLNVSATENSGNDGERSDTIDVDNAAGIDGVGEESASAPTAASEYGGSVVAAGKTPAAEYTALTTVTSETNDFIATEVTAEKIVDQDPVASEITSDGDNALIEDIVVSMHLAVADRNRTVAVKLNGVDETFIYVHDPVNGSSTRKLFRRESWKFDKLYWYNMYGAMTTSNSTIITPAAFQAHDGSIHLCWGIGETMCHRPRYDGLCINTETDEVTFRPRITAFMDKMILGHKFDFERIEKLVEEFLIRNRWFFEPKRGLVRACKEPMKPDTALRKFLDTTNKAPDPSTKIVAAGPKEAPKGKGGPAKAKGGATNKKGGGAKAKGGSSKGKAVARRYSKSKGKRKFDAEEEEHEDDEDDVSDDENNPGSESSDFDENPVVKPPTKKTRSASGPISENHLAKTAHATAAPAIPANKDAPILPSPPAHACRNPVQLAPNDSQLAPQFPIPNIAANGGQPSQMNEISLQMIAGIMFENIKQKAKLEILERNEATRREEEEKHSFQKQLEMLLSNAKFSK